MDQPYECRWRAVGSKAHNSRMRTKGIAIPLFLASSLVACGGGSGGGYTPHQAPVTPLSISAASISIVATGSTGAQSFTASESGYSGAFTQTNTCSPAGGSIAAVSPASAGGPSATFTVTGVTGGSCTVTIHDTNGQSAAVNVTITLTGVGVS